MPIAARCSTRYGASLSDGPLQLPPAATIGPPLAATLSWQWLAGAGAGWHTAPHITLATGVPVSVSTSSKAVVLVMNIACRQTSNSGANVTGLIDAVSLTVLSIDCWGAGDFSRHASEFPDASGPHYGAPFVRLQTSPNAEESSGEHGHHRPTWCRANRAERGIFVRRGENSAIRQRAEC